MKTQTVDQKQTDAKLPKNDDQGDRVMILFNNMSSAALQYEPQHVSGGSWTLDVFLRHSAICMYIWRMAVWIYKEVRDRRVIITTRLS